MAHIVDGADIAGGAGIGHRAGVAGIANQAAQVVVPANDIAGGSDVGQGAVVVAHQAADGALIALHMGSGRAVGERQMAGIADQPAYARAAGGGDRRRRRVGVADVDVVGLAYQAARIAAVLADIAR